MAEKNKKEQRQQRRSERQQAKIEEYKAGLSKQPAVDIGPLGSERKARIDKAVSDFAGEELREGLKKFQGLYKAPDVKSPVKPTDEPTIKDVRRAKRAKIADILSAFGSGLRGEKVDPTFFRDRLARQRDPQYQQYKETVQKGKQQLDACGNKYLQDQLDYLEGLKTEEVDPLKKRKMEADIANIESLIKARERKPTTRSGSGKVDLPSYTYKTDDGQTIKIPMQGEKKDLIQLTNAIQTAEKLKIERDRLQKEMENELYQAESTGFLGFGKSKSEVQEEIRQKYADDLQKAISDVQTAEAEIKNIFERNLLGEEGEVIQTPKQTTKTVVEEKTEEDELWES